MHLQALKFKGFPELLANQYLKRTLKQHETRKSLENISVLSMFSQILQISHQKCYHCIEVELYIQVFVCFINCSLFMCLFAGTWCYCYFCVLFLCFASIYMHFFYAVRIEIFAYYYPVFTWHVSISHLRLLIFSYIFTEVNCV